MRKMLACLLALCVVLSAVSGCGREKKPKDMNDTAYRCGKKVVEITEQYLNMDVDRDEAYEEIKAAYDRADADAAFEIVDFNVVSFNVGLALSSIKTDLLSTSTADLEIEEDLRELKKQLGEK